jgi:nitrile hydratase accessory protein
MTERHPSLSDLLDSTDSNGPVFDVPWQARTFGVVVAFHDDGDGFDWMEFQERLTDEIAADDPDIVPEDALKETYYEQWLAAFERLLVEEDLLSPEEIEARAAEFAREERSAEEFVDGERLH